MVQDSLLIEQLSITRGYHGIAFATNKTQARKPHGSILCFFRGDRIQTCTLQLDL